MARNSWLNKKFYQKYTIAELKEYFDQYTTITDIMIEEYGLYSQLSHETKQEVSKQHPFNMYYYDDEWAYVQLMNRRY